MDFLNQASAQITNLFRSMSVGARIVAGLLIAVIVISLAYLFNHQFAGPDSYLMGGEPVTALEINSVTAALGKAGLNDFRVENNQIRVPRGQEAAYMAALLEGGALPKNYGSYLQKALSESGPLVSKSRERQMNKVALQMELQGVIRKLKGISDALVLYEVREQGGVSRKTEYSASVMVSTVGGERLDDGRVTAIRTMVASSIGMPSESVAVTDLDTGFTYPPTKPGQAGAGWQDQYIQNKIHYEKLFADRIRDALSYVPGVVVACTVELKDQIEHSQHTTKHDPKPVNVIVSEESKTLSSQGPGPSGPPGLGSQGGVPANQPAVVRATTGGAKTDEEESRSSVRSVTNIEETHTKRAPLTPSRVTAAIAVPSSFLEQTWLSQQNPPAPGEEPKRPSRADLRLVEADVIKSIQEHAAQLIPLPDERAANPIPLVKVTVFEKLSTEPVAEPGISDHALAWLGTHWSTLGTGLLGLVSLVMLRSMVRSVPAPEPLAAARAMPTTAEESAEATAAGDRPAAAKQSAASRLKRREKGGPSLREELVEVVREDPEAAANVLRSWINSAT